MGKGNITTHRSINICASVEQTRDDWFAAVRGSGMKWKEAFENAVDWLTLAESIVNERCTLGKRLHDCKCDEIHTKVPFGGGAVKMEVRI